MFEKGDPSTFEFFHFFPFCLYNFSFLVPAFSSLSYIFLTNFQNKTNYGICLCINFVVLQRVKLKK